MVMSRSCVWQLEMRILNDAENVTERVENRRNPNALANVLDL